LCRKGQRSPDVSDLKGQRTPELTATRDGVVDQPALKRFASRHGSGRKMRVDCSIADGLCRN
jgi:hypothetical protein